LIRLSLLPAAHARTFQRSRLRYSHTFYGVFNLATGRSRGFGPFAYDYNAHFALAFATAPCRKHLALPPTNTRRSIMQKVRRHPFPLRGIGLRPLVSAWFQVLFTRLVAVLFIVQSPYSCAIGHRGVFSLGRWAAPLHTEFHELRATLGILSTGTCRRRVRDFHPLWRAFPGRFRWRWFCNPSRPLNPGTNPGLGCVRFRSPLLTESMSLSSPAGTEMFQFPAFASHTLCVRVRITGVRPARFPDSEILGSTPVCRLPEAYRRLPRPSSPLDAKTSTVHPY
jgi:hypothetical protein